MPMNELKEEIVKTEEQKDYISETVVVKEKTNKGFKLIVAVLFIVISIVVALIAWFAIKTISENIKDGVYKDKTVYVGKPKNFEYDAMTITIGDKFTSAIINDELIIYNDYYEITVKIIHEGSMDEFALSSFIKSDLPMSDATLFKRKGQTTYYYSTSNVSDKMMTDIYVQNGNQLYNLEITSNVDLHFKSLILQWANSIAFEN